MGSAILRAVGDSTRPFYFLVVAALLNSALDLLFVVKIRMGVAGVAWATIIAQGVSASLVVRSLLRSQDAIRLELRRLKFHWDVLKKIFKVGIPAALQLAVTSFSNVFVQSYINYFGDNFMSGWTAFSKINQIVILPMQSLSLAITTFVGQNLGAGLGGRAKKSVGVAFCLSAGSAAVLMVPMMFFAPHLVAFFNPKPEVIRFGTQLLRIISPFYLVYCVHDTLGGALRGAGNGKVPMIITLACFVAFRQLYLFVMANFISNTTIPIAMSYPAGWVLCSVIMFVYYRHVDLSKGRIVSDHT
jgi:putative MATE family efflux protein